MDDDIRKRRENTRSQFESNDPDLTKLTIDTPIDYLPPDGDWERDGKAMGRNEHIKEICFSSDLGTVVSRDKLATFCSGLACNKSVEKIFIRCCQLFGGEIFNVLSPFFEQNSNLRCLTLSGGNLNAPNGIRFLSESLLRFNTLRGFECCGCKLCENDVEMLIQALAGHNNMTNIDLGGNKVGEGGVTALAALINNTNCSLADLNLSDCYLNDEGAVVFADALGRNSTLKKLNLGDNSNITATGWSAIFTHLQSPQSPLEDLDLWGNSIEDAAANLLGNALTNNAHLKILNFSEMISIATEGWRSVFDVLQSPRCMLQELDLHDSGLRDEHANYLASSLSTNCVLRSLSLHTNEYVTAEGWRAFSAVLQNPNSALEKIDLSWNNFNDDMMALFANSLVHNSKLKELFLDGFWGFSEYEEEDITITNWDALSNALCNKSSINETSNSNHTIQQVVDPDNEEADESQLPSDLQTLLQLNRENTTTEAARRKILKVHFRGAFNMQPFIDMLKVLPHAIAWMARDEYGSSLLYQFVRNTTFFVGIGGVATNENERESKRQRL